MARRLAEDILSIDYKPNDYTTGNNNLFEGCVVCNDGTIDGDAQNNGLMGVVLPSSANAIDGGWSSFEGILDTGGSTVATASLFVQNVDRGCKVQKFGWAKCKGKASTTFNVTEPVGYVPSDAGVIVPLRVNPLAVPIGICRQQLTVGSTADFVTVELIPGIAALLSSGERLVGQLNADSAAATGNVEAVVGTGISIPANFLRANSIVRVSGQVRMTAKNGADTVGPVRIRLGGLAGALLCSTGATAAFAANDVASFRAELEITSATTARLLQAVGILGTPDAAATQTSGGGNKNAFTIANINTALVVQPTILFSSNSAGNTGVLESLAVTAIR